MEEGERERYQHLADQKFLELKQEANEWRSHIAADATAEELINELSLAMVVIRFLNQYNSKHCEDCVRCRQLTLRMCDHVRCVLG